MVDSNGVNVADVGNAILSRTKATVQGAAAAMVPITLPSASRPLQPSGLEQQHADGSGGVVSSAPAASAVESLYDVLVLSVLVIVMGCGAALVTGFVRAVCCSQVEGRGRRGRRRGRRDYQRAQLDESDFSED